MFKNLIDKIKGKIPPGAKRSPKWPIVRLGHLTLNPTCAVCAGKKSVEVHHKEPFHLRPDLELDPSNLITLCEAKKHGVNCHLFIGHKGNYRRFNPDVERDAFDWQRKLLGSVEKRHKDEAEKLKGQREGEVNSLTPNIGE